MPHNALGTIFVAMDHKPWATHGHGPNHVSGQNFALVAPTLETNDSQSLLMVIFAHSLDYRHSFSLSACLIHQCSFLHFLVVVVNIFCCAKSCWRADPPDAGAEDNGANMNIKTLPGSARGQQSNADWRTGKLLEPRIKWASRESSHRGSGGINWISITGAADASLMGFTVSQGNDDEDHLDRGRWDEAREQHDQSC